MMIRSALLFAALIASASALPEYMRMSPNLDVALHTRSLFGAGVTTYEDALVRRLEGMEATATTDAELREQAKILFELYKALKPAEVEAMGATEEEQFEVFYKTVFQKILARVNATPKPTAKPTAKPTTKPTKKPTTRYSVVRNSTETEVDDNLSFFYEIYDDDLASDINALQDNTQNMEAIVQSTKGSNSSDPATQFQSPTVLEGTEESPSDGSDDGGRRRLQTGNGTVPVQVLFCDVGGNAIWKWSHTPYDPNAPIVNTTEINIKEPKTLCESPVVEVKVTTYQSGCSLKNHPEGCDNVYFKGCGGLTVNRDADRVIVARTGGRSLGMLYYKNLGEDQCQGRVVDAISTYKGKRFNSISYVEYSPAGDLYFTDSPFGLATGPEDFEGDILDKSPLRELDFNGVFMLKKGATKLDLLECAMDRPNKIAFSPKGDVMYITNSRKGNSYVKQFNLADDGLVKSSSIFFNFTSHPELQTNEGYADGIKTDSKGNVYVAAYNGIFIFSPEGALIGNMRGSQVVSGVAIGGGRMFLSGSFGIVAQATGVAPSISLPKAKTDCA